MSSLGKEIRGRESLKRIYSIIKEKAVEKKIQERYTFNDGKKWGYLEMITIGMKYYLHGMIRMVARSDYLHRRA